MLIIVHGVTTLHKILSLIHIQPNIQLSLCKYPLSLLLIKSNSLKLFIIMKILNAQMNTWFVFDFFLDEILKLFIW